MPPFFIAVHAGAGYHGHNREAAYNAAMWTALKAASHTLENGQSSMDAVKAAICALENAPITNAGYGANLTLEGSVECDASIMAGDGTFAAVGAMPGIDNPIAAAHRLAELAKVPLPCGLVRPVLLVGDAARRWAIKQGLEGAADAQLAGQRLVSPAAQGAWQMYSAMLAESQAAGEAAAGSTAAEVTLATRPPAAEVTLATRPPADKANEQQRQLRGGDGQQPVAKRVCQRKASDPTQAGGHVQHCDQPTCQQQQTAAANLAAECTNASAPPGDLFDTVGCVVVDCHGCVAAGVSSGGLLLKQEGRVGEAAVAGAGCWAADGSHAVRRQASQQQQQHGALQIAECDAAAGLHPADAAAPPSQPGNAAVVSLAASGGVAVSVSGVGERIISATLAKATAMQLQVAPGEQLEPLLVQLMQTALLSQQGPWDAGILAVRVDSNSSSCAPDSDDTGGSSSGSSSPQSDTGTACPAQDGDAAAANTVRKQQQKVEEEEKEEDELLPGDYAAGSGLGKLGVQQQRRVRVELVAAFTAQSFAVGWLGPLQQGQPHVEVLRQRDGDDGSAACNSSEGFDDPSGARLAPTVKCLEFSCSWPCTEAVQQ